MVSARVTFGGRFNFLMLFYFFLYANGRSHNVSWLTGVFNKTVIPLQLVGYERIHGQPSATGLVGFPSCHVQRALVK